jgi:lysozyme
VTGRDPRFLANVAGAKAAGLYVGPYWFAYPLPHDGTPLRDPADQAKFAFDCAGGLGDAEGELPPMLDLEWPPPEQWAKWGCTAAQIRRWALDYLDAAEGYWGCRPAVYTYPYFWGALAGSTEPRFAGYPLCVASYRAAAHWPADGDYPVALPPWSAWTFWQWTGGKADLPGGGPADFEVFSGDEAALAALCGVAAPQT